MGLYLGSNHVYLTAFAAKSEDYTTVSQYWFFSFLVDMINDWNYQAPSYRVILSAQTFRSPKQTFEIRDHSPSFQINDLKWPLIDDLVKLNFVLNEDKDPCDNIQLSEVTNGQSRLNKITAEAFSRTHLIKCLKKEAHFNFCKIVIFWKWKRKKGRVNAPLSKAPQHQILPHNIWSPPGTNASQLKPQLQTVPTPQRNLRNYSHAGAVSY